MDNENNQHTLLIVDDSIENIEVLNEILADDYRILFATNGSDAIQVAIENIPDLILMDVMMPEMDGYEASSRLKSHSDTKDIPIIFVTAVSDEGNEVKGLSIGAVDYITKPVRPLIVQLRVKNHLELKRYRDFLMNQAFVDGLTGIPNRRKFEDFINIEWKRAFRSRFHLALIMADIDYFKQYNDTYGHIAGDDCLRRIAKTIDDNLERPADLAARYGGEEFICVLPETSMKGALGVANKLAESVATLNIAHNASNVSDRVTISMGIGALIPGDGMDYYSLVGMADNALYKAKQEGRNRIEVIDKP